MLERFCESESAGVTVELITKYRATVYSDRGELFLRSRIVEQTSRLAKMHVELFNADGTLGSEADVVYRIFPENVARQRLGWTGIEAFHPEENEYSWRPVSRVTGDDRNAIVSLTMFIKSLF